MKRITYGLGTAIIFIFLFLRTTKTYFLQQEIRNAGNEMQKMIWAHQAAHGNKHQRRKAFDKLFPDC